MAWRRGETRKAGPGGPAFLLGAERVCADLLELDGLVRADLLAGAALGAVVRAGQNRDILEVEGVGRALVNADAAGGAQIGIDDRLAH
jgi:hypothetical protein